MLSGHDGRAERSPQRAGRGGVKTLAMKIPGAEREALLEMFCPRQDLCRERTTPVRNHRVDGRKSVRRGEAAEHGCQRSAVSNDRKNPSKNSFLEVLKFSLG